MPKKYADRVICAVEALISRSREMSPKAAAIMLADMMGISWPKEKIMPMVILRCEGQLYGSAGSVADAQVLWLRQAGSDELY